MQVAGVHGYGPGNARSSPQLGTLVGAERMKVDIVESLKQQLVMAMRMRRYEGGGDLLLLKGEANK